MRLGIDIGTDHARAAFLDEAGRPRLVCLADGATALPTLARQTMHGLQVGGDVSLVGNAETTITGCTRLMGRAGELPPQLTERLPYALREVGGETVCDVLYAEVRPSDIYGELVATLVAAAEAGGTAVDGVVLTVPASAENRFRVQARAAVEARGITVLRLINQPAAALLALDLPPAPGGRQVVAVVNCSGGTTEVSLAERGAERTRILATAGDAVLGGDDLAWAVAEGLAERFRQTAGLDVATPDSAGLARAGLRRAAGEALEILCLAPETMLVLDHGAGFGRDLATLVRRSDADAWLEPLVSKVGALCERALSQAGLAAAQVDEVVMIGESAHLPQVRLGVAAAFGRPAGRLRCDGASELAVAGAALATAETAPLVWDVTPYPLGINCYYGSEELFSPIIAANTPIPTPAVGAPGAFVGSFSTRYPDQTEVRLDILQYRGPTTPGTSGPNRVFPEQCEILGSWTFSGLHPKPGAYAPFTVTFAIDADGILHLYAKETGKRHSLKATIANYER